VSTKLDRNARFTHDDFWWVELATGQPDAEANFYADIFGWSREPVGDGWEFHIGHAVVAGMRHEPSLEGSSRWIPHVNVVDVEGAARLAAELGGDIDAPAEEIPGRGFSAIVSDPLGSRLALWESAGFRGADAVSQPGCFTWAELATTDPKRAGDFYAGMFGWQVIPDEQASSKWTLQHLDGRAVAGLTSSPVVEYGGWNVYFSVADCDEVVNLVKEHGGREVTKPVNIPAGRFAWCEDPQGARFAVIAVDQLAGIPRTSLNVGQSESVSR
jgi:predicted enzyme related to lactoylglutathione lyase